MATVTETPTETMQLEPTDLDEVRSSADSEEQAPNASDGEEEVFVPKEPEESAWPEEWPKDWVKPKFAELELKLADFKKAHKNALPSVKELPELVFGTPTTMSDEEADLLFKIILGTKNAEGKLDQQGQKGSMRQKWKAQFPKTDRAPEAVGFKLFADEAMLLVDESYVPLFESYVEKLDAQASKIDKGHAPTALLKQAHDQLKRIQDAQKARKTRVEDAQKKRREAEVAKARAKAERAEAKKAERAEAKKAERPTKTEAEVKQDLASYAEKMEAKVLELRNQGVPLGDCFKQAREALA